MPKNTRWVRLNFEGTEVLMETQVIRANSLSMDTHGAVCPCCLGKLKSASEFIQWGYVEDKYTVLFVCPTCHKAYWYSYTVPLLELTPEGYDVASTITIQEIPREAGSERSER